MADIDGQLATARMRPHTRSPIVRPALAGFVVCCALAVPTSGCGGGGGTTTPTSTPAPGTSDAGPASPPERPTLHALQAEASVADGSEDPLPDTAAAWVAARTFHVDPTLGDDTRDGSAATPGAESTGPWRSLARAARHAWQPGDHLVLACGGVWRESLTLRVAGLPDRPIVVRAAADCSVPPTIDGSEILDPAGWQRVDNGPVLWRTPPGTVLGLLGMDGLSEAHHPNRGHDPDRPDSVYLPMAADGDTVTAADGHVGSQTLALHAAPNLPAGASLAPGLRLRVRVNSYHLEERRILGLEEGRARLDAVTRYPLRSGWGYFLLGAPWMVDSPGEWLQDTSSGRLLLASPSANSPPPELHAVVRARSLDLRGSQHVQVEGLRIRRSGTAVAVDDTRFAGLRKLWIEETLGAAVTASGSTDLRVRESRILRAGGEAVDGGGIDTIAARRMQVTSNLVVGSGVVVVDGRPASLPASNRAAVLAGYEATVSGNVVIDSAYIGVRVWAGSRVGDNQVHRACQVFDDCGAIYTWGGPNGSTIERNVVGATGQPLAGKPPNAVGTSSQGIYLDESATGVQVLDNTVFDCDNGIHVHQSSANVLEGNRLFANRQAQIRVQETRRLADGSSGTLGNRITGNQIAVVRPRSVGVSLQTTFDSTAGMAELSANRYHDRAHPAVGALRTSSGSEVFDLPAWQALGHDSRSSGTGADGFSAFRIDGDALVPNGDLASGSAGWSHWNATAPSGSLSRGPCPAGWCLTYGPGGSPGLVSSPYFSVESGRLYRLVVDIDAALDLRSLRLVVRRGGGGTNGYESLMETPVTLAAQAGWRRVAVVFRATQTILANDPLTQDRGARVDIENITGALRIANLDVRAIRGSANASALLANGTGADGSWTCDAASLGTACAEYVDLGSGQALAWPAIVPARSGRILIRNDATLIDSDRDGIADLDDLCPSTTAGAAVDNRGCSAR